MHIKLLNIDFAKNDFQLHGVDERGNTVLEEAIIVRKTKDIASPVPSLLAISLSAVKKGKSSEDIAVLQTRLPEEFFIHLVK